MSLVKNNKNSNKNLRSKISSEINKENEDRERGLKSKIYNKFF
jgi:hypothetical protein